VVLDFGTIFDYVEVSKLLLMSKPDQQSFNIVIALLLLGALISGVLVLQHYNQTHEAGLLSMVCGSDAAGGCNAVNRSEYSSLLGVPVASLGFWYYLAMALVLLLASLSNAGAKDLAGWFCFLGVCVALAVDVALLATQVFLLKAFCTLCLSTYAITLLLFFFLRPYRGRGGRKKLSELMKAPEWKMLLVSWIAGVVLLLFAVVAGSMVLAYRDPTKLEERFAEAAIAEFLQSPEQNFDLRKTESLGAANASIKVVIYSDFLCPYCRQTAQWFQQHMPQWKDRVALYYKNYPLDHFCNPYEKGSTHPGACWTMLGGICAGEQGKFWDYHDRMFTVFPKNPSSDAVVKIGAEAGLDTNAMSTCMHQVQMQRQVREQIEDAHNAGITGTPRIFINGRKLPKITYLSAILASEAKRLGLTPLEGLSE
jgi:uncharacterized membrane protein/glutaredoxin